ncbi:MAG: subtype I-E CRISPR-associated protein CasD [Bacteroidetes bacterium HLUCCA01]|nr:MAG: subtype I-E CRISPR-associated protein CasD [Bacteroidetes bacterium HLUCCA01]
MKVLLLTLQAPMMSFGAPMIDHYGVIQSYPASSLLIGMMANALGLRHHESDKLNRLQQRMQYACRQDRAGSKVRDYQTADLGQEFMLDTHAWTTRGKTEERKGGGASKGTHIRLRDYFADARHTIALTLTPETESPTLEALAEALKLPERPLFIGRKNCLPSAPVFAGLIEADNIIDALLRAQAPIGDSESERKYRIWWPAGIEQDLVTAEQTLPVTDQRDWENQIHVGDRLVSTAQITLRKQKEADL